MERGLQTLLYIRKRLGNSVMVDEWMIGRCSYVSDVLCHIDNYGAYLAGAKAMFRTLKNQGLLDIPKEASSRSKREDSITNEALLKLYLKDSRNLDWFLHGVPGNVEVRIKTERDKKGKTVKATAFFVKRETTYQEV